MKVVLATTCPSCLQPPHSPTRARVDGVVVHGCVDHFHSGHLQDISASLRWHNRADAKKIRAAAKAGRGGFVTEFGREGELCTAGRGMGKCMCEACLCKRFARALTPSALW